MLIQCKLGPASPDVLGTTYTFHRDDHGRFVALVEDARHQRLLLAVEHYVVADDAIADEPVQKAAKPRAKRQPKSDSTVDAGPQQTEAPAEPVTTDEPVAETKIVEATGLGFPVGHTSEG